MNAKQSINKVQGKQYMTRQREYNKKTGKRRTTTHNTYAHWVVLRAKASLGPNLLGYASDAATKMSNRCLHLANRRGNYRYRY